MSASQTFTRATAEAIWARLVAGWADHLDPSGARTLIEGHANPQDAGGSYEGVTRMLWGLGGWLSQPGRPTSVTWRGDTYDIVELTRSALVNGTDSESPGYWLAATDPGGSRQRIVESGQVAFALWQSRDHIWNTLDDHERENIVTWLERSSVRPEDWHNNWALFWAVNHTARRALGVRHDPGLIDSVLDWLDDVYCGNGWYDDGPARGANHFDDYNFWVFGSHVLAWSQMDGDARPDRRDELLNRVQALMAHVPYMYGADGAYPEYGRSLSYKFARLGAPLWAYAAGAWPHDPGMLRRLVGRHISWYVDRGAIRADGTLRQELTYAGHPDVRETYISTGATYWAMQAFGALWTLADDDPFWTCDEQPLPVETDDFVRVLAEPGWIMVGEHATGHVTRVSGKSQRYAAKYGKFSYSTAAPFNVGRIDGMAAPDNMVSLVSGDAWSHRTENIAANVSEPGWIRCRHRAGLDGLVHTIESVIVVAGTAQLRLHRVELDPACVDAPSIVEGASPVGHAPGAEVTFLHDPAICLSGASVAGIGSSIRGLGGWHEPVRAAAWRGDSTLNAVFGGYMLPTLASGPVRDGNTYASIVTTGSLEPAEEEVPDFDWNDDGSVTVAWSLLPETVTVPPLG